MYYLDLYKDTDEVFLNQFIQTWFQAINLITRRNFIGGGKPVCVWDEKHALSGLVAFEFIFGFG